MFSLFPILWGKKCKDPKFRAPKHKGRRKK
jgi:hypothetical protein